VKIVYGLVNTGQNFRQSDVFSPPLLTEHFVQKQEGGNSIRKMQVGDLASLNLQSGGLKREVWCEMNLDSLLYILIYTQQYMVLYFVIEDQFHRTQLLDLLHLYLAF